MRLPFRRSAQPSGAPRGSHDHGEDHPDWCTCGDAAYYRRRIDECGWLVITVPADEDEVWTFHYTAGLTREGLPELIVYGVPAEHGADLLNSLASRLLDGEVIADGTRIDDLVDGPFSPQLWTAVRRRDPLGVAEEQYGDQVMVRQLVLPDRENRMPWEADFDDAASQPVLYAWAPV